MPVWRPVSQWLTEAVTSALDNDVDLELILVDDGNPEPVQPLLDGVADPRLRFLRIDHGGVGKARNAGTGQARGRFLRYLDADDVVEPASTARLLAAAAAGGVIAYQDTVVCDEQLRPRRTISSELRGDVVIDCLLGHFDCRHVSMLFPAEVVRQAGPWDPTLRVRQDFDFVLRCLEHAPVEPVEGIGTFYRRHAASATYSPGAVATAQATTRVVLAKYLDRHPADRGGPVERAAWQMIHGAEARSALYEDRLWTAATRAARLARVSPREAAGIYRSIAGRGGRLSGAAIARTIARARAARPRTDR